MKRVLGAITAAMLTVSAWQASAQTLVLGLENVEYFPWQLPDGIGADIFLMETAARNLGYAVDLRPVPWRRCLNEAGSNAIDGCFSASFEVSRMDLGVYPMAGNRPDTSKALHADSYSLYVPTESDVRWTGSEFENLSGDIGAIYGYSIVTMLENQGAGVFKADRLGQLFQLLLRDRLDGVAALTAHADHLIEQTPELNGRVRKVGPPLDEKHYYLLFSHGFAKNNPEVVLALYDEIKRVRKSPEYRENYEHIRRTHVEPHTLNYDPPGGL
jgi:polar amino acid transport system substrate-binding protein